MKIGSIIQWSSNTIPDGFLLCDGTSVSRTTYAELFSIIGTTYGSGDGSTTFNVPDYRDRVPVGLDTNDSDFNVLGKTLGEKTHTLTIDEMPSHNHSVVEDFYDFQSLNAGIWGQVYKQSTPIQTGVTNNTSIQNKGGGQPHNIIQPSIVTNYIIKALNPDSIKISELESASSITSSDVLPIVQNGETKKVTVGNLIKETYSTDEIDTGKVWIDGKPIYRKCFSGNCVTDDTIEIDVASLNIDKIVSGYGWAESAYHNSWPIPCYYDSDKYRNDWLYTTNTKKLRLNFYSYYSSSERYNFTLEYTKTTD